MKDAWRSAALLAVWAILLAGCSSPEDRIAKAFPAGKDVEAARAAFDTAIQSLPAERKRALDASYAAQLKLRALECGKGYQPGAFETKESIHEAVGNADCFVQKDAGLRRWLGMQRVGLLAAMPPLRPVPAKAAPTLAASDTLLNAVFAETAGVALLQTRSQEELVDLVDGKVLRVGERTSDSIVANLSSNGRLLVRAQPGGAVLQDAETGEVLVTVKDANRVHFAGGHGLVYADDGKPTFHDFASGSDTALPFQAHALAALIPVPGKPADYVLLGDGRAALLSIACQASGCTPQLRLEGRMPGTGWAPRVAVMGEHAYFFGGRNLVQLQLATLQAKPVAFDPMSLMDVMPTRVPGTVFVRGMSGLSSGGPSLYLYASGAGTLAKVDAGQLPSTRLVYAAPLRTIMAIDGARLVPAEPMAAATPEPLISVLRAMQFDVQVARLEMQEQLEAMRAARGLPPDFMPAPAMRATPPGASRSFPPGQAGLTEAVRAGVLRPGNSGDVNAWKSAYTRKTGRSAGQQFDDRTRMMQVYVVTGDLTIPSGLAGANAVVFVLNRGAPFPRGNAGHSMILDVPSGSCSGATCGMALQ